MSRIPARTAVLALLLCATVSSACAPGRSIVRGSWPDGRIHVPARQTPMYIPEAKPVAVDAATDEWLPAEPAHGALTAADLNRMGVLQEIHFGFDSAAVESGQIPIVEANARWLADNPTARIIVEGHCDERGTRKYNMSLGQRRANATRDFLISLGVDPSRIEVVSYGEELPEDPASNERAWAMNRRAVFVIVATRP